MRFEYVQQFRAGIARQHSQSLDSSLRDIFVYVIFEFVEKCVVYKSLSVSLSLCVFIVGRRTGRVHRF